MKYIIEYSSYYNLHGDDDYDITKVERDKGHEYQYCDGILYELSLDGTDITVNIDEVEHTEENTFYQEQIKRYIEYFQDGGIVQSFPVQESKIGGAYNLQEMLEYLSESENFDLMWDLINQNKKLYDDLDNLSFESDEYGIEDGLLTNIEDIEDLNEYYNKDYGDGEEEFYWIEDYYNGFKSILEYWNENKEYTLTDFNHRFAALKEMGKSRVIIDPS